ncbi:hypothetical protein [Microbacterium sp. zg.Y909]|nr:hypothetical protein [Microbacterium sp. zg.Y909]
MADGALVRSGHAAADVRPVIPALKEAAVPVGRRSDVDATNAVVNAGQLM